MIPSLMGHCIGVYVDCMAVTTLANKLSGNDFPVEEVTSAKFCWKRKLEPVPPLEVTVGVLPHTPNTIEPK